MLKSIRDDFRTLLNVFLWFLVIASGACGVFYGATIGQYMLKFLFNDEKEHPIWGAIIFGTIGLIAGYILLVLLFGYITTLLNIDENLQKLTPLIVKRLSSVGETTGNENGFLYSKDYVSLTDNMWICRKCGTANKLTRIGTQIESADDCRNCGRKLNIDEINLDMNFLDI